MNLAIFFDAVGVTGRTALLAEAKSAMAGMMRGERALIARFANLVESFETPALGVLSTLQFAPLPASNGISDLNRMLEYARAHGAGDVELVTG